MAYTEISSRCQRHARYISELPVTCPFVYADRVVVLRICARTFIRVWLWLQETRSGSSSTQLSWVRCIFFFGIDLHYTSDFCEVLVCGAVDAYVSCLFVSFEVVKVGKV